MGCDDPVQFARQTLGACADWGSRQCAHATLGAVAADSAECLLTPITGTAQGPPIGRYVCPSASGVLASRCEAVLPGTVRGVASSGHPPGSGHPPRSGTLVASGLAGLVAGVGVSGAVLRSRLARARQDRQERQETEAELARARQGTEAELARAEGFRNVAAYYQNFQIIDNLTQKAVACETDPLACEINRDLLKTMPEPSGLYVDTLRMVDDHIQRMRSDPVSVEHLDITTFGANDGPAREAVTQRIELHRQLGEKHAANLRSKIESLRADIPPTATVYRAIQNRHVRFVDSAARDNMFRGQSKRAPGRTVR
jgi:hypothetical protein